MSEDSTDTKWSQLKTLVLELQSDDGLLRRDLRRIADSVSDDPDILKEMARKAIDAAEERERRTDSVLEGAEGGTVQLKQAVAAISA